MFGSTKTPIDFGGSGGGVVTQRLLDVHPDPVFAVNTIPISSDTVADTVTLRKSGGGTASIGLVNGEITEAALTAVLGGDTGFISAITDTLGSGYDFNQATEAAQPKLEVDENGVVGFRFGADGGTTNIKSAGLAIPQPLTIYLLQKGNVAGGAERVFDGTNVAGGEPFLIKIAGAWKAAVDDYTNIANGGTYGVEKIAIVMNGANSFIQVGNQRTATNNPGAGGFLDGITLGSSSLSSLAFNGYIYAYAVYAGAHTPEQVQAGLDALEYPVQLGPFLAEDGDSQAYGTGSANASQVHVNKLVAKLALEGLDVDFINSGNPGENLSTTMTTYVSEVLSHLVSTRPCAVSLRAGTNDISNDATGASVYANWVAYGNAVKATGAAFILTTIVARGGGAAHTPTQNTERLAANALARANATPPWDYLSDLGILPQYDEVADAEADTGEWYFDKVHIAEAGNELAATNETPTLVDFYNSYNA